MGNGDNDELIVIDYFNKESRRIIEAVSNFKDLSSTDINNLEEKYLISNSEVNKQLEAMEKNETWSVGDTCKSLYTVDGQYYEAIIKQIDESGNAHLTFIGYGNKQVTPLTELLPSEGAHAIAVQREQALEIIEGLSSSSDCGLDGNTMDSAEDGIKTDRDEGQDADDSASDFNKVNKVLFSKRVAKKSYPQKKSHSVRISENAAKPPTQPTVIPQTLQECVDCIQASSYLYGYYTGYYECMKKSATE